MADTPEEVVDGADTGYDGVGWRASSTARLVDGPALARDLDLEATSDELGAFLLLPVANCTFCAVRDGLLDWPDRLWASASTAETHTDALLCARTAQPDKGAV